MTPTVSGRRSARRWMFRFLVLAAATLALVLASTAANLVMERSERASIPSNGERVQVSGGALNVYRTAAATGSGRTLVLLSGLGTAAPALDFSPLIRELDDFNVVVVEGFGYGYSDTTRKPRTVENISAELHEALSKAHIRVPYILAGHSIAGFYTLFYANRYRQEVSAVIGIDPTLPVAGTGALDAVPFTSGINWNRLPATTGLLRWAAAVAPGLVEPDGEAYTADERKRIHLLSIWNYENPAVVDETNRIAENGRKVQNLTYPDDMPVLTFLAEAKGTPAGLARHENRLRNVRHSEVVVLPGGHYLHWTQAPVMAEKIRSFLPPSGH